MHEHELHVSRALSATKLHALKHACRILDALDPATQFAEMRRLIGVILAARADDIEPHFGCSVPPVYGPPKPPHTDPNYNADHLEDLPPAPAGIVHAPGAHRPKPRAQDPRQHEPREQEPRAQASDESPLSPSPSPSPPPSLLHPPDPAQPIPRPSDDPPPPRPDHQHREHAQDPRPDPQRPSRHHDPLIPPATGALNHPGPAP